MDTNDNKNRRKKEGRGWEFCQSQTQQEFKWEKMEHSLSSLQNTEYKQFIIKPKHISLLTGSVQNKTEWTRL